MRKKKPVKPVSANFKNHPFSSLKGFTPNSASADKQTNPAPRRARSADNEEDDAALFLRAVGGARPVNHKEDDQPAVLPTRKTVKTTSDIQSEDNNIFLSAMLKIGTTFREQPIESEIDEISHKSQAGRMRQLKRGAIKIGGELDLHGLLRDEAILRLERFIAAASTRGEQAVLVITGKGINSAEGPVLKGAVDDWLRSKGKGRVVEFHPAPRDLGGSGAFVVFLKKKVSE